MTRDQRDWLTAAAIGIPAAFVIIASLWAFWTVLEWIA
jgi:hypothetical protein